MNLFEDCAARYVPLGETGFGEEALQNINTPEEYRAVQNAGFTAE